MITILNKHHGHVADGVSSFYIGRGSPLGNPYSHMHATLAKHQVPSRIDAIESYEKWLREQIRLNDKAICDALNEIGAREVQGLDTSLVCFCEPQPCHGRVIKKIILEHLTYIDSFSGPHRFLSNFWMSHGLKLPDDPTISYPSVEHAYQAAKTLDLGHRRTIWGLTAGQAKRFGRQVTIRPDWEGVKLQIMEDLLRQKFAPGTTLAKQLDATGDAVLIEGNRWGDQFWGVCRGTGENYLGRLLMKIRRENRYGPTDH